MTQHKEVPMSIETNKAIVKRFFEEVFNKRNLALAEEFIAPTYTNHSSPIQISGPQGAKRTIAAELEAFPDLHTTIEDILAEGDKVVVRCTDRFTNQPDGRKISLTWIEILRLENSKAVEAWFEGDIAPMMEQLNAALARK
jgi:predicted SnoaL-like aldol condensation-catalyzing enzyme